LENKCRNLKDIISVKDRKIIALVDQILFKMKHNDVTIELKIYSSTHERKLWAKRRNESEHDLETLKKYTFRLQYLGKFYSLAEALFSKTWSQPRRIVCGCARGTVKSKTMNFCSHNDLSIILI